MTVSVLPTIAFAPRKHQWGESARVGEYADRTERTCVLCGLVKITVHPPRGFPWREWRTRAGKIWQGTATPPCLDEESSNQQDTAL